MFGSEFIRNAHEKYYTEPAVTGALARRLILPDDATIWEPCAGRGDMVAVLQDFGFRTVASDLHPEDWDDSLGNLRELDFIKDRLDNDFLDKLNVKAIVTNPPFGKLAEQVVRKALSYEPVELVACFMRSEWRHGSKRRDLFESEAWSHNIELTWRPRWDWWFREKPEASPRHNYSWYIWDKRPDAIRKQQWATRTK